MLAEQIFATVHVMRKAEHDVQHMFRNTGIFDNDDDYEQQFEHSPEEVAQLQAEMAAFQKQGLKI